ncbi:EAL domain-containing protein [Salaquimonas pukyongi]|uniref:EAL domain-containing protein n=1 Tax=Salaquimonas pukyongi TaxID=2712698 RepID=UPI00096B7D9F|nr:EAL domain-containing protein [Salaquimonas pukyongi]
MSVAALLLSMAALLSVLLWAAPAQALEPVSVTKDLNAIDISNTGTWHRDIDGSLKISTAPDRDGIVRRVEIRPRESGRGSNWYVFALANDSSEQIDRLIVAPHYRLVGAGLVWPDLDSKRIVAITPSEGFSLEAVEDREADVFLITLNPGAVITLIAEMKTDRFPQLVLWELNAYKDAVNSLTLYRGIVLGISGLLAMFLTILFMVKGTAIFPATAALAWGVLAYVCVDFGFWDRVVAITQTSEPYWRAATEVFLAFSILLFLYSYLRLNRWSRKFTFAVSGWLLALGALAGFVLFDPAMAAGLARFSFAATIAAAGGVMVWLAFKRDDRAIMLVPTWLLCVAWLVGGWMTVTGQVSNDIIQPALGGGLVLIVLLIAFTIMQNAFSGGALAQGLVSNSERQSLALLGAGDILWDWDTQRDSVTTGEGLSDILGIDAKRIDGNLQKMHNLIHPNDRERFQATLDSVLEHKRGQIAQSFRLCAEDGHYHWFRLKARPMLGAQGNVIRCIGTLTDITDAKKSEIRLLQDAVRDNLTGLENRELFINRLDMVVQMARRGIDLRPSVFHVNIDRFREINRSVGFSAGDTLLLTVARRLAKLLNAGDSIARIGGDQFAILLLSESEPDRIAGFADTVRKTLNAPVTFGEETLQLTASIGISTWTKDLEDCETMMRDAELAMLHAKRLGGNRIEPFRPAFRTSKDNSVILAEDLREAISNREISVSYQPIVQLSDNATVGFEALVRWNHPKLGLVSPSDFIPAAERSGMIQPLGLYVLLQAITDFKRIHDENPGFQPFVSVNVSSRELLREDFTNSIEETLSETGFSPEHLKIEITETMVMENPEHSRQVLARLRGLGVGLSIDDFGTGYSSLSYLTRFPFDTLKIDSSFLQTRNRKERTVVLRSIIAMAHGLNQSLVAEGVEHREDVEELQELGCEFAQGFFFGPAITADEVSELISEDVKLAGQ